jgi:hypothetical protein
MIENPLETVGFFMSKYVELLNALGADLTKDNQLVASPFKFQVTGVPETTPSFSICISKELWYDFSNYPGKVVSGGNFIQLAGLLGLGTEVKIADEHTVAYTRSMIEKYRDWDDIAHLISRNKPEWNPELVKESPFIGWKDDSLVFYYSSFAIRGIVTSYRIATRSMLYSFARDEHGKRIRKFQGEGDKRTPFVLFPRNTIDILGANEATSNGNIWFCEGESDAITLSEYNRGGITASFYNTLIPRFFAESIKVVVFADKGAEEKARAFAAKMSSQYRLPVKFVTMPANRPNNTDISDLLRESEDKELLLLHMIENAEEVSYDIGSVKNMFFLPLGMDDSIVKYQETVREVVKQIAPLNTAVINRSLESGHRVDAIYSPLENPIFSTAYQCSGYLISRYPGDNMSILNIGCYESTPELCVKCEVYNTRKVLSLIHDGTEDSPQFIRDGTPNSKDLSLAIYPGTSLTTVGTMATSREIRQAYMSLFGMNCSVSTRPEQYPMTKIVIATKGGGSIIGQYVGKSSDIPEQKGIFCNFYGYFGEGNFYILKIEPVQLEHTDDEVLMNSKELMINKINDNIDMIESAIGKAGRSPRKFIVHFLASALSGYFIKDKYYGCSLFVIAAPNTGKSFVAERLSSLLQIAGPKSWSSIKETDLRMSSLLHPSRGVQIIMPIVVVNDGYMAVVDDYQASTDTRITFSSMDSILIRGVVAPHGTHQASTGEALARCPLIFMGNADKNVDPGSEFVRFANKIGASDFRAAMKRFGIISIQHETFSTTSGQADATDEERNFAAMKLHEMFHVKSKSMEFEPGVFERIIATYDDEGQSRRYLSFINMVRAILCIRGKVTNAMVDVADHFLTLFPFDVNFGVKIDRQYWSSYIREGSPFDKRMKEPDKRKAQAIVENYTDRRTNRFSIEVQKLFEALDPLHEYAQNSRDFFNIADDDPMHNEEYTEIKSSKLKAVIQEFIKD